ncbi:hypothetical protein DFP72DRAFT_840302 [Ephemerocybe angulata]|uniref:Uncharacterized protein n=1 Tax=Ephemerocybe angulata TaxID=980116 RepID=A0A8H6MD78_9AGAR|nr:hypothetical protein DFP72DRAFT_840302 [Tulosesus angulatus]
MSPEVAESQQGAASWTYTTDPMGGGDVPFTTVEAGLCTSPVRTGRPITHQSQSRVQHPACRHHPRPLRRTYATRFPPDIHTTPTPARRGGRMQNEAPFTTVSELVDDSPTSIALGRTILLDQFQLCSPDSPARLPVAAGPSDPSQNCTNGSGPGLVPYQHTPSGNPQVQVPAISYSFGFIASQAGVITEPCSPQLGAGAMHPDYPPTASTPRLTSDKVQTEQVEGAGLGGNLTPEPYQCSRSEAEYNIGYWENHNSNTEYHLEVVEDSQENIASHDWDEDASATRSVPPSPVLQVAAELVPGGPVDLLVDGRVCKNTFILQASM